MTLLSSAAVAQNSISKSISDGWESVVKDASKAAKTVTKSVSKAADDAMGTKKPRKKKSAKKSGPDAEDDKPVEKSAKPRTQEAKQAPHEPEDDGPPVPLTRPTEPQLKQQATPAKRLPPPPEPTATTAAPKVAPNNDTTWSASSQGEPESKSTMRRIAPAMPTAEEAAPEEKPGKPLPITMVPPKEETKAAAQNTWSKEEIEAAKANCTALLKGIDASTIPEAPVKEGNCGTPAPVRLVSIGKNPEVALSPPPLVTCELVAGLVQWMKNDIQPLSKKTFGSPVIKIETMSDYSCRMAYGRKGNKLSEHGKANALDIRGFVTAMGESVYVLEQWGKTARDLKAEAAALAAQKAAAEKATAAAAAAGSKSALEQQTAAVKTPVAQANLAGPALKPVAATQDEAAAAVIVPNEPRSKRSQFLHDAHTSACRIFGTSLGPESNEAHRNHFHVDMAERKRTKICE